MARQSSLRASDADRDAVAEKLRVAAVEGRLDADELDERVGLALRARTYGDLSRLLIDLPSGVPRVEVRRRRAAAPFVLALALRMLVVVALFAVVVGVMAVGAVWLIIWGMIWLAVRGGRGHCSHSRHATWQHTPRVRRI
jgi:hypothetical protein